MRWLNDHRPGYFGRKRDSKISFLNTNFGEGKWRLAWVVEPKLRAEALLLPAGFPEDDVQRVLNEEAFTFADACRIFYEHSYWLFLRDHPGDVDFICSHGECIDNDMSNIASGCDYTKQESWATHIQDIAVRNVLRRLERKFEGPSDKILVIRSADSNGFKYGPGNVPFYDPKLITQPSLSPKWANAGSVEDFWQSNKWVQIAAE
jgi:hypothetical protein